MNVTLFKLGGSLITDKSKPYTARPQIIHRVLLEIKSALQKKPDINLVLGHGAGSFAHQSAKKFGTIDGFNNDKGKFGACFVHADAMKLHEIVLDECMKLKLPIFSLQPASFLLTKNKKVYFANFEILEAVLKKKMIPLIFGDVIIDTQIGATIYSTDKLFSMLANYLQDKNYAVNTIKPSIHADVTGAMEGKIKEAIKVAERGIKTLITDGSKTGQIADVLLGKRAAGTTISKD